MSNFQLMLFAVDDGGRYLLVKKN